MLCESVIIRRYWLDISASKSNFEILFTWLILKIGSLIESWQTFLYLKIILESFLIKNRSRFKIDSHIILGLNVKAIKCNKQMASLQNRHELLKAALLGTSHFNRDYVYFMKNSANTVKMTIFCRSWWNQLF